MLRVVPFNDINIKRGFKTLIYAFSFNKKLCTDILINKPISAKEKAAEYMLMDITRKETFLQTISNKFFKTNYHTIIYSFKNSVTRNYIEVNSKGKIIYY